jgi:hypothetical protein
MGSCSIPTARTKILFNLLPYHPRTPDLGAGASVGPKFPEIDSKI